MDINAHSRLNGARASPAFWRTQEMLLIDQVVRPIGKGMQLDPSLSNLCGDWHVAGPEQRKATTVEPMKPMEPMKPLSEDKWWPPDLGQPSTSGSQNDMRYAFFLEKRRLLIEQDGSSRPTTAPTTGSAVSHSSRAADAIWLSPAKLVWSTWRM